MTTVDTGTSLSASKSVLKLGILNNALANVLGSTSIAVALKLNAGTLKLKLACFNGIK